MLQQLSVGSSCFWSQLHVYRKKLEIEYFLFYEFKVNITIIKDNT